MRRARRSRGHGAPVEVDGWEPFFEIDCAPRHDTAVEEPLVVIGDEPVQGLPRGQMVSPRPCRHRLLRLGVVGEQLNAGQIVGDVAEGHLVNQTFGPPTPPTMGPDFLKSGLMGSQA
jgi:hypothetical protein